MALYRYTSRQSDDGKMLLIGPEMEETPCAICGGEAHAQVCPGDGRYHHHGCVHRSHDGARRGGLDPVCNDCYSQVWREWNDDLPMNATWEELMQYRSAKREKAQAQA